MKWKGFRSRIQTGRLNSYTMRSVGCSRTTTSLSNLRYWGQHPLHHVLIGAVRSHRDEGGAEECSPDGVFRPQHLADILQKRGIRLGTRIEKNHVFGSVE